MCVSLQNAIPFLLNWLGETRIKEGERGPQLNVWNEQRGLCYVGISMGCASILNIIVNIVSKELVPIIIGGENPDKHPLKYLPVFIYSILISAFLVCSSSLAYLPSLRLVGTATHILRRSTLGVVSYVYVCMLP